MSTLPNPGLDINSEVPLCTYIGLCVSYFVVATNRHTRMNGFYKLNKYAQVVFSYGVTGRMFWALDAYSNSACCNLFTLYEIVCRCSVCSRMECYIFLRSTTNKQTIHISVPLHRVITLLRAFSLSYKAELFTLKHYVDFSWKHSAML